MNEWLCFEQNHFAFASAHARHPDH